MACARVALYQVDAPNGELETLLGDYELLRFQSVEQLLQAAETGDVGLILVDIRQDKEHGFDLCAKACESDDAPPVVFVSHEECLQDKLKAFEVGGDDYLLLTMAPEELQARLSKALFNKIANDQLKSQVQAANKMVFTAMANTSDVGVSVHFLLESHQCDNIDQLGQLFFQVMKHFDLSCSIQMRSVFGTKNMEANGMAKDLESQLLDQLRDHGRYYDFGHRTIINYGCVSVLIKNMPQDDPERYGSIKDNTFALIQGLDARVEALDAFTRLEREKLLLKHLSEKMQLVMTTVDKSFHAVMRDIATVVDDMSDAISESVPLMSLSETEERQLESTVENGIMQTQRVFNRGLSIDESFAEILGTLQQLLAADQLDVMAIERLISRLEA